MTLSELGASADATLDAHAARALTDQIKVAVEGTWQLIERAYVTRAWAVLGYLSWDDYCQREFGTSRLRLPREERQEVVASLRESGLSTRAIAAATGVDRNTVMSDLRQVAEIQPPDPEIAAAGVQNRTPQPPSERGLLLDMHGISGPVEVPAGPLADELRDLARHAADDDPDEPRQPLRQAPPRVTGTDGKAYATTRPAAPSKPRIDVPRVINSALIQIANARRALDELTPAQVAHQSEEARRAWTANLSESLEALTGFLEAL